MTVFYLDETVLKNILPCAWTTKRIRTCDSIFMEKQGWADFSESDFGTKYWNFSTNFFFKMWRIKLSFSWKKFFWSADHTCGPGPTYVGPGRFLPKKCTPTRNDFSFQKDSTHEFFNGGPKETKIRKIFRPVVRWIIINKQTNGPN